MKQFSEAFSRRLEGSGITRIQWIALYYISEYKQISQRELAKFMSVKDSSIGRLIDRLQRDGLVRRVTSEKDRRVFNLEMTDQGSDLFGQLIHIGEEFNNQLTEGISDEELQVFDKVLNAMLLNVKE